MKTLGHSCSVCVACLPATDAADDTGTLACCLPKDETSTISGVSSDDKNVTDMFVSKLRNL